VSSPWREIIHGVSALMVVVMSYLHLSDLPFSSNKERRWVGTMRVGLIWFIFGAPVVAVVAWLFHEPGLFFEYVLFSLTVYIFLSWTQIPKSDLAKIRAYLDGGEVEQPLVHRESEWLPSHWLPYADETPKEKAG